MAQRTKIGIIYSHSENWIGGTYYILNLISACKTLPAEIQPHFVVFTPPNTDLTLIEQIAYPFWEAKPLHFSFGWFSNTINTISQKLLKKKLLPKYYPVNTCDLIFPYNFEESLAKIPHRLTWIADFQEQHLPHFFSEATRIFRKKHQEMLIKYNIPILFSSQDAQNHFHQYYPKAKNESFVLHFAVSHPPYKHLSIEQLYEKHHITQPYFIIPNQFWVHKNHQIVIEAIRVVKSEQNHLPFTIVFTGKEYDFRYPHYAEELKQKISQLTLSQHFLFLGFIDRAEQLQLMKNAIAVVQPSLFEGWSTVVEDAKAMNQYVIASDIEVHREQMQDNVAFFDKNSPDALAKLLLQTYENRVSPTPHNYQNNIQEFAKHFIHYAQHCLK